MITFKTSNTAPVSAINVDINNVYNQIFDKNLEAYELNNPDLIHMRQNQICNQFLLTIHEAFANHRNLVLSPDDIWTVLMQGFATHINKNPEKFRKQFVSFDGKKELTVRRDEFVKGSKTNNWKGVFSEFSDLIGNNIGKARDMMVSNFSTTKPIEKAVSEVLLMDVVKEFFSYRVMTMCGIPTITLLGETEDWKSIKNRFNVFAEYDLNWWISAVNPILDQFISASKGNIDNKFWPSIYKHSEGSGGESMSGWIGSFFPYIFIEAYNRRTYDNINGKLNITETPIPASYEINKHINDVGDESRFKYGCMSLSTIPAGFNIVPFIWEYYETEIPMEFCSGFVGVAKDMEYNAIRPAIGWAIRNKSERKMSDNGRSRGLRL